MEREEYNDEKLKSAIRSIPQAGVPCGMDRAIMERVTKHAAQREKKQRHLGLATTVTVAVMLFAAGFITCYMIFSPEKESLPETTGTFTEVAKTMERAFEIDINFPELSSFTPYMLFGALILTILIFDTLIRKRYFRRHQKNTD